MNTSILDATEAQLRKSQAKLTFLGPQTKPIPTVVFFAEGHSPSMEAFVGFHHSHRPYANDDLPYTVRFTITPAEFLRLLSAVKPVVVDAASLGTELISLTIVHQGPTGRTGEEFIIKSSSAEEFYKKAIGALNPDNEAARNGLAGQAGKIGLNL